MCVEQLSNSMCFCKGLLSHPVGQTLAMTSEQRKQATRVCVQGSDGLAHICTGDTEGPWDQHFSLVVGAWVRS